MEQKNGDRDKPKYFDRLLDSSIGKRVVVVERNGCMSFGTLTEYSGYRLSLVKVKIQGKRTINNVPWIIIERGVVAHVHPDVEAKQDGADAAGVTTQLEGGLQTTTVEQHGDLSALT